MKLLTRLMVLVLASHFSLTSQATVVSKSKSETVCDAVALEVASYIDKIGWGEVRSEPLLISDSQRVKKEGVQNPVEVIKVHSSMSGFKYSVTIEYFSRQDACVVRTVETTQG